MSYTRRLTQLVGVAGAIATLSAALTGSVYAVERPTGSAPQEYIDFLKRKPMEVMHMMDTGNKGFVTKDEFAKFHEGMFERMDKNHDGKLTTEEWLGRQLRKTDR